MAYRLSRWSLDDLYPGFETPELESAFDQIEEQVTSFEGLRGKLTPDMEAGQFMEALRASESFTRLLYKLDAFAGLAFAANTQDQAAQTLQSRVQQFAADITNRTLFFSLWWKDLDEANAQRLMEGSGDYRYYLEEIRHFKPHTLSEPEEKVINLKDVTGASALITLYDAITNRYAFKLRVDGERREMTRAQLSSF